MMALSLENITVRIGARRLLDGFSLQLQPADVVALIGPNGAGKTTLLRCILGRVAKESGRVLIDGVETQRMSAKHRAGLVAHLAQQTLSDDAVTVLEYVATARFRYSESRPASERAASRALQRVDAADLLLRRMGALSGGERQRVALAALLAQESQTLLLDEPANHLDPARQAQSYALLGELQQEGKTMLVVTHDINLLGHLRYPEQVRVVGLKDGRNAFDLRWGSDDLEAALSELYATKMRRFTSFGQTMIAPARNE